MIRALEVYPMQVDFHSTSTWTNKSTLEASQITLEASQLIDYKKDQVIGVELNLPFQVVCYQ